VLQLGVELVGDDVRPAVDGGGGTGLEEVTELGGTARDGDDAVDWDGTRRATQLADQRVRLLGPGLCCRGRPFQRAL